MYGYMIWPGAYSFKEEVGLFMEYLKLGLYKRRLNWYNSFVDKMYMCP